MKCLSICQPWADLIVFGPKRVENRSWYTPYRGPLLIHASKSRDYLDEVTRDLRRLYCDPDVPMVFGAILGVAILDRCVRPAAVSSPWTEGPWCWVLSEVRAFAEPIPWRGAMGLFDVPDEVFAKEMVT